MSNGGKEREDEKGELTPKSPILPCNSPKAPICSTKFFLHISQSAFSASAAERDIAWEEDNDGTKYDKTGGRWVGWNLNHSSYASDYQLLPTEVVPKGFPMGGKKGKGAGRGDVRIKQTTVRRNLSSPFPEIGRVANVPKISLPNNVGRLTSSPRGTASEE
jgi:hypothetical protein